MLINLRERNRSDGRMGYRDRDKRKERRKSGRLGELLSRKARRAQDKERKRRHLNHLYDGTCRSNMNAAQKMRWECAQSLREIMKSPGRGKKKRASEKRRERKKERKKENRSSGRVPLLVLLSFASIACALLCALFMIPHPETVATCLLTPALDRPFLIILFYPPTPTPTPTHGPERPKHARYTLHSHLLCAQRMALHASTIFLDACSRCVSPQVVVFFAQVPQTTVACSSNSSLRRPAVQQVVPFLLRQGFLPGVQLLVPVVIYAPLLVAFLFLVLRLCHRRHCRCQRWWWR